jgi:hypothetical protein
VDAEQEDAALAAELAARFARLHPETAHRLKARAENYLHPPLADARPTTAVTVAPEGTRIGGHDAASPDRP